MKIGNLDIGNKIFLAPMAEVTDSSFRKIAKENGVGIAFTQMVSALGVLNNNFESLRLFSFSRDEKPIGVQVLGNDAEILGDAVKELKKFKPDLIDLNSGCPVDKVVNNNMGSALLDDPRLLGKLIRKMADAAGDVPVSVKLRLGKDRKHVNVLETARAAEDNGASLVFVHARARGDKYDTSPDWEWIGKVKEILKIPVVGNGSLLNPADIKAMIDSTGCDSAMVARGALGNPFIFDRFNKLMETGKDPGQPELKVVKSTLLKHLDYLKNEFGELKSLDKAKKQVLWYFRNYTLIEFLLDNVFSAKNYEELESVVNTFVENLERSGSQFIKNEIIESKFKKKVLFWLADTDKYSESEIA